MKINSVYPHKFQSSNEYWEVQTHIETVQMKREVKGISKLPGQNRVHFVFEFSVQFLNISF